MILLEGVNQDEGDSNRSGKSAIIEALVWCLWDKTIRGIRSSSVPYRDAKKGCYVRVFFTIGDVDYEVARYQSHPKHKNNLYLFVDGKDRSYRHKDQTQQRIAEILGCSFSSFINSVVFGGAKPFAGLSDAEQKKVLESFLHFEQIDSALKFTKEQQDMVSEKLVMLERRKAKLDGKLTSYRSGIRALQRSEDAWKKKSRQDTRKLERQLRKLNSGSNPPDFSKEIVSLEEILLRGKPCPTCGQPYVKKASKYRKALKRLQDKQDKSNQIRYDEDRDRWELERRLEEAKKDEVIIPFAEEIESLQTKISREFSRMLKIDFQIDALERHDKDLEFWVRGFGNSGVKAIIVRKALPAMNAKLEEYAQEVFNGKAELKFSPTKTTKAGDENELFNLQYQAKHGAGSYAGESSGGRKRVDICCLLVFSWMSRLCNLLLVDELLDGLDSDGQESVLGILSKLKGTVLCVTHRKDLKARFQRRWVVTKQNGISTLNTGLLSSSVN